MVHLFFIFQAEHTLLHDATPGRDSLGKDDDDDELLLLAENGGVATPALGGRLG